MTSFPEDNITMIIPQGLGGGSDLIARTIASELEKILGVSIICKNVDGGSTSIGLQELTDSKADGYTIAMTMTNLATLSALCYSELTLDDFTSLGAVNFDAACIMIRTDETRYTDLPILEDAIKQAVESDTYQDFIASQQSDVFYLNGADYYDFMTEEVKTHVPLLEQADLAKE